MASVPVNLSWPGTGVQVMLAGEPRDCEVLSGPPVITQPARERIASQIAQSRVRQDTSF